MNFCIRILFFGGYISDLDMQVELNSAVSYNSAVSAEAPTQDHSSLLMQFAIQQATAEASAKVETEAKEKAEAKAKAEAKKTPWEKAGSGISFDKTTEVARQYSSFDKFVAEAPQSINRQSTDLLRAWNRAHPSVEETTLNGIHIVKIRGGTPSVLARHPSQKFTEAAQAEDKPDAKETTINMNLYGGSYVSGILFGPDDPANHSAEGEVISGGQQIGGQQSNQSFYVAYNAGQGGASQDGTWSFGQGNPPHSATVAFGGGKPLIANGLPYGTQNTYSQGAPGGLPTVGDPGAGNQKYLTQRSNAGFSALQSEGTGVGVPIIGYDADTDTVYMVVQPSGSSGGMNITQIRDMLIQNGVDSALAFDGSNSATLVRDSNIEVPPARFKDNTIPFGLTVRTQ